MRQWQTDLWLLCHMNRGITHQHLRPGRKSGSHLTEMRAIRHTIELIAHSLFIANDALAEVAREGWPGKTALFNEQSMGPKVLLLREELCRAQDPVT